MNGILRSGLRLAFAHCERALGIAFPSQHNPLLNLGALCFFLYWIITVTGIYLFIFYDTNVHGAYASLEHLSRDQWYAGGVMRSLHRYASDALVALMGVHLLREFAYDRYRGARWFSWVTGVPILVLVFVAGITGYWMVWDGLAQYIALVTTEWLDRLPIFGEPIARNFLSSETLESRFFTLMVFMHIAVPLIALVLMWVHLQRISRPRINPPRALAVSMLGALIALSLVKPALSQAPADLGKVPAALSMDWFYLVLYPLLDTWPGPVTWTGSIVLLALFAGIPWLPPMRKPAAARVDLENCNGCTRCFNDCPYNAILMGPRTDGLPFETQAVVNEAYCVGCGICAGACPTSTPFRKASVLSPGIDLPDHSILELRDRVETCGRRLTRFPRIMVFGCEQGVSLAGLDDDSVTTVSLRCAGQLPPSMIDYVLSRGLAECVVVTGCAENACYARYGVLWTEARAARTRDPYLRARVPRQRLKLIWPGRAGAKDLRAAIDALRGKCEPPVSIAFTDSVKSTIEKVRP
ncbi:MAG: hydrogenase iron-sulfur subunit [Hyphomicrobiales bacterium]|nr:MAG: hydrogenase iron-sulfur subunit [Hyphomicrobiales bacterium]